eukprot:13839021-Alexandrium_andersonii.AAC.1
MDWRKWAPPACVASCGTFSRTKALGCPWAMASTANCLMGPRGSDMPPPFPAADHAWQGGPAT